jgi:signal transduction histidine kinase
MMNGLSSADFAVLGPDGEVLESSRKLSDADRNALAQLPQRQNLPEFSASQTLDLEGGRFLASRLRVRGEPTTLVVLYPEERWSLARREVIYPPLVVGGAAVFMVTLVTTLLARRVVRPLESLQRQAAAIEKGIFQPMPLGGGNDEIQDLTRSINHMVKRLASYEADVRRNERLRTLGQLGAGIAHQMRNAATGARLAMDLHRQDCPIGETCEALDVASRQLSLIEAHSKRFLVLGRNDAPQHELVDLGQLVDDVLPLLRPACNHARIDLQFLKPAAPAVVSGDVSALGQLLINLLTNAIEAAAASPMPAANGYIGVVSVSLKQDGAGPIECRVSDSGVGPSDAVKTELFEPFVSDKPDGTGLGLAVAQQIARQHDAELSWHRDDQATQFVVSFATQQRQRREVPCAC